MTTRDEGLPVDGCVFCPPEQALVFLESPRFWCLWSKYPDVPGHALIVPKAHETTVFAFGHDQHAEWSGRLLVACRHAIREFYGKQNKPWPEGYEVKINVGKAAGQVVAHAHIHVIPRGVAP